MKKIKLVSVDIQADLENLLMISKEIANTFGNIYNNNVVEAEEFSEQELLEGDVNNTYCPNDYIIENYKKAIEEEKDFFNVCYETPYYEVERDNRGKMLTNDVINLTFSIINY